jgi:hypothetical protein
MLVGVGEGPMTILGEVEAPATDAAAADAPLRAVP